MIPPNLAPAARSAYRAVLRSARITFSGDPMRHAQMLTVLRTTFESPTLTTGNATPAPPALEEGDGSPAPDPRSPAELEKRVQEWKEVAHFLRQNVVQGQLDQETGRYRLRVHEDTEMGNNEDIKTPPKLPVTPFPNRGKKKCWD